MMLDALKDIITLLELEWNIYRYIVSMNFLHHFIFDTFDLEKPRTEKNCMNTIKNDDDVYSM